MSKFVFSPELKEQVDLILSPLKNPEGWMDLDLDYAKYPSAVVRMEGLPGTGKTALADYMARQFDRVPVRISFADIASPKLGQTEQETINIFQQAMKIKSPVVIIEECDSIFWSRDMVTEENTYMLSFVNTFLVEIDRFINRPLPSLLILTTNHPKLLDEALESRITDVIKLLPPTGAHAKALWRSKIPDQIKVKESDLELLAASKSTPRQIERAIIHACRRAFKDNRTPKLEDIIIL